MSERITVENPFCPMWETAFAVYRVQPMDPVNPDTDPEHAGTLLQSVSHSRSDNQPVATADCILEKGRYSIVLLSFDHFLSAGIFSLH